MIIYGLKTFYNNHILAISHKRQYCQKLFGSPDYAN